MNISLAHLCVFAEAYATVCFNGIPYDTTIEAIQDVLEERNDNNELDVISTEALQILIEEIEKCS